MKNTILKSIGTAALAILMLAAIAPVSAQETDNGNPNSLEGSWSSMVTIRDCQTDAPLQTFPAMQSYMNGGTMIDSAANPYRAAGHGVWSHQTGRNYSSAFQYFSFNPDGSFAGTLKVRQQNTVSKSGDSFTTVAAIEVFAPNGTLVGTGCATAVSTRFE